MSSEAFTKKFNEDSNAYLNGKLKIARFNAPFYRFRYDFPGLCEGRYYLLSAGAKGAKTQCTVYVIVDALMQYLSTLLNGNLPDIKPCFIYIPLEESERDILARMYSLFIFKMWGKRIDKDSLIFSSPHLDNERVREITEYMNRPETKVFGELLDECFQVKECTTYSDIVRVLYSMCEYVSNGEDNHYFFFASNGLDKDEKEDLPCMTLHEGQKRLSLLIIDHVSLIPEAPRLGLKESIDKLSKMLVYVRNKFKISSWVVQQQSTETMNAAAKSSKNIEPTATGLADSKYTARDCNLFLGVTNPYYFSFDNYHGYDISQLGDGVRFLSVIMNRNGVQGGSIGLEFDGACQYFNELPKLSDTKGLEEATQRIMNREMI